MSTNEPMPGWYPDPAGTPSWRWWDGHRWGDLAAAPTQPVPPPPVAPQAEVVPVGRAAERIAAHASDAPTPIYLPEPMVSSGQFLPAVCVRHGRPATRAVKISFHTRVEWWVFLLLIVNLLVMVIVAAIREVKVTAPAWPVCDDCGHARRRLPIGWAFLLAGPFVVWLLFAALNLSGSIGTMFGILVMCAGLGLLYAGSWSAILKGSVDPNTRNVMFKQPSPEFVAALPTPAAALAVQPQWGPVPAMYSR